MITIPSPMYVVKRNGDRQTVRFDKITDRIVNLIEDSEGNKLDAGLVAQKVVASIYPGITTEELDVESAKICINLSTKHPLYAKLASRILISNLHKKTSDNFVEKQNLIQRITKDHSDENIGLLNEEYLEWINQNKKQINNMIDYQRDFRFDFFGFKTLERAYLIKNHKTKEIYERPQDMFMRVASFINMGDLERVKLTYDLMSQGYYTHASPTLFNGGTRRSQLSSCFLLGTCDSMDGITDTWKAVAAISKWGGGIGLHVSNIRAKDSLIRGTNGPSSGLIPMLQVYNNIARYVNQCFMGSTIVYTKNGPIEMKDIKVNNKIITKDGTFKKVKYVYTNKYSNTLLKINIENNYSSIYVTKKHPFYVIKNQSKTTNYDNIKNRLNKKLINFEWCDAENLTLNDFIVFPIPQFEEDCYLYDEADCFFYGLMIGNGHISTNRGEAELTFNIKNKKELIDITKKYLLQNDIHFLENDNNVKWNINHKFKITRSQLYDNNNNKIIDPLFLHLPKNKILQIISGILKINGSISNEITLEISSKNIIDSVRYLLMRLGILTSGYCRKRSFNCDECKNCKDNKWILKIPKDEILSDTLGVETDKYFKYIKWNNMLLSRISCIEQENYDGMVYDLEIDTNHNYLTETGLVHNGGKRKGSIAIYLEPHHPDIMAFLDLRKNFGAETERARDLFLAVWISDLFMEQVEKNGDWYLFCPDEAPKLCDVWGDKYKKLYWKYVEEKRYREKLPARKVMKAILDSQLETGTPYICYKDAANAKSNQQNLGTIKSSNLCIEIIEYSDHKEHAVCNLASIAINRFVKPFDSCGKWLIYTKEKCNYCRWSKNYMKYHKFNFEEKQEDITKINPEFKTYPQIFHNDIHIGGWNELYNYCKGIYDFDKLYKVAYEATINLNKVIDINFYPTKESKRSNLKHRPIGLGIQGLADTLVQLKIQFDSEESIKFNAKMMETIYFASVTASKDMAKKRLNLLTKLITDYKENKFNVPEFYDKLLPEENFNNKENYNLYHKLKVQRYEMKKKITTFIGAYSTFKGSPISKGKFQFDLWDVKKTEYDWTKLREEIKKYGIRNSLLTALMPTASTSQILGNNECFEFFTNNIYTRRTLAGDFPLVNRYLIEDLVSINEWSNEIKQLVLANNGSIQLLKNVPNNIKKLYKNIWELRQIWVLKNALARAPFVDQSQSMNIHMAVPDYRKLYSSHFWAWKNGLKTGIYYLRTKPSKGAAKFTVDPRLQKKVEEYQDEVCDMCSA